ncbi:ComEA family DNA-binding protein [Cnuibacter sp. UC19_7]|uniref:ComEA family DNA-binding protein n=1 Tax=Cnuibacter sp. UC19_7 TaxID=3350166 RepID=UPI00366A724C
MSDLVPDPTPPADLPETRPRTLRIGVGAAIVLVVVALVVAVVVSAASPVGSAGVVAPSASPGRPSPAATGSASDPGDAEVSPDGGEALLVHVLGAVAVPGLYRVVAGARVVDAVAAAGGFAADADRASVNLARPLADGEQLRVLAQGEAPPPDAGGGSGADGGGTAGPIDLNRATLAQLDELPRIGPATAQRIIDYRETNGPFASVDDLLEVPGIGDKTLGGIRDLVRV